MARPPITSTPIGTGFEILGMQDVVQVVSPAAATDWTWNITGGYWRRLIAVTAQLVTSATVTNRAPALQITDGSNVLAMLVIGNVIAASNTALISWNRANYTGNIGGGAQLYTQGLPDVWLPPGYVVRTVTTNISAGDQWSKIVIWSEAWDFGSRGRQIGVHGETPDELADTYIREG